MKSPKLLLTAPAIALFLGVGLIAVGPAAYADSANSTFRGTGTTESEAHQRALNGLIDFEKKNSQECHQVGYKAYLHPNVPSTRLSGFWQYSITAYCQAAGVNLVLENLTRGSINLFPSGKTVPILKLAAEPEVSGEGVYFAYSVSQRGLVHIITGIDVPELSVKGWESVAIALPSAGEIIEVRYGSPDSPAGAQIVGSVRALDADGN